MASFCVTLFDNIENPSASDSCFVASNQDLTIAKGSSYKIIYQLTKDGSNVDLSGYSLRGYIKPSSTSSDILLELNTSNLLLEINNNSTISMNLKESFTRRVTQSFAVYDIELINSSSDATKIITGLITFV